MIKPTRLVTTARNQVTSRQIAVSLPRTRRRVASVRAAKVVARASQPPRKPSAITASVMGTIPGTVRNPRNKVGKYRLWTNRNQHQKLVKV